MMKINYIANYNGKPEMGVTKKLLAQIEEMNRCDGVEAKLIFLYRTKDDRIKSDFVEFYNFPSPPYKSFLDKLKAFFSLNFHLKRLVERFDETEIIYFRNYFPTFGFLKLLRKYPNKKIFFDVVSNNIKEAKIRNSNYLYRLSLKILGSKIANCSKGVTGVTSEIIKLNFPKLKENIPTLATGNGFNPESVPVTSSKSFYESDVINFICVAHISKWHGLDRFILGMANYDYSKNIHFHLIGEGPELNNIKQLVKKLGLEDKVTFYGFKNGSELDELFELCHIGVGNLGTHRKNIKITSPLKSKEYCSRGIPFFYTCIDEDFIDFPFIYNVESNDTPINITDVLDFYKEVSQIENYNLLMRKFAEENVTWKAKVIKLINFLKANQN